MNSLMVAFYGEGTTDERFLPSVIRRTAETILCERQTGETLVAEPFVVDRRAVNTNHEHRTDRILEAARRCANFHALVVHTDADGPTWEVACQQRFKPGEDQVAQAVSDGETVCAELVPIIPIRMTEAWLLADPEALLSVIGTEVEARALGIPTRARLVERVRDPKQKLEGVLRACRTNRGRRRISLGTLYEPLGRRVSLERLALVPAYQQFVQDLTDTLVALSLAR